MASSGTASSYNYNARGERVWKAFTPAQGPVEQTDFIYEESGHLLAELNGSDSTEIIWLEDLPVAVKRTGIVNYIHADHLGTPRAVVTSGTAAKAIWQWDFLGTATGSNAFGDLEANADPDADGTYFIFNLRFPGQQKDQTGLNYNYFRDYEPATGRYVESDPIGLRGGINSYTYVGANPSSRIDPRGETTMVIGGTLGGLVAGPPGAIVGAAVVGVVSLGAIIYYACGDERDCEREWREARKYCSDLFAKGYRPSPNGRGKGGMNYDQCVRGQVSEACGGDPIE